MPEGKQSSKLKEWIWTSRLYTFYATRYRQEAVVQLLEGAGVRNSKNEEMITWASKCLAWKSLTPIMGGVTGVVLGVVLGVTFWILLQPKI